MILSFRAQRRNLPLLLAATLLLAFSCCRMPLYDKEKKLDLQLTLNLELNVDIDMSIETDIDVVSNIALTEPEYMRACFFDPVTGEMTYYKYLPSEGGDISIASGSYKMLVYSFGTEYTQIRNENNINNIEAFTSDITDSKISTLRKFTETKAESDPIIYAPDHLLVAIEEVTIPEFTGESLTITLYATANTIVETYTFEVHSVVGAEYIESAEAFVTNQARSYFIGRGEMNPEPATIFFPVGVDKNKGCLYTAFNTFGKLPGASEAYLHILVRDTGGNEYAFTTDITDQFENPDRHIVIDEPVDIPEPEQVDGGIAPTVDPWDEENHDVPIG